MNYYMYNSYKYKSHSFILKLNEFCDDVLCLFVMQFVFCLPEELGTEPEGKLFFCS